MTVVNTQDTVVTFLISGSEKEYNFNMKISIKNFRQLGIMLKKMTCLFTTRERVTVSTKVMSRLSFTTQMPSLCGIFLHQMVTRRS